VIQSDLEKKAVVDEVDGTSMATGTYLAMVRLEKRLTCLIPIFGQKMHISLKENANTCKKLL
jgi:hypothetical protein